MKHLFSVAFTIIVFTTLHSFCYAQTSINLERLNNKPSKVSGIKFIESIEILPSDNKRTAVLNNAPTEIGTTKAATPAINLKKAGSNTIENCTAIQFKYALLMDIDVEFVTNMALYQSIEEWWGTKYRYGGTTKAGIDCSAFCGNIFTAVYNTSLPRTAREQYATCNKVSKEDMQQGDLVFFNTKGGVSHVGIYLGNDCFVHSSVHSGVTINKLTDDYYSRKFIGAGRIN